MLPHPKLQFPSVNSVSKNVAIYALLSSLFTLILSSGGYIALIGPFILVTRIIKPLTKTSIYNLQTVDLVKDDKRYKSGTRVVGQKYIENKYDIIPLLPESIKLLRIEGILKIVALCLICVIAYFKINPTTNTSKSDTKKNFSIGDSLNFNPRNTGTIYCFYQTKDNLSYQEQSDLINKENISQLEKENKIKGLNSRDTHSKNFVILGYIDKEKLIKNKSTFIGTIQDIINQDSIDKFVLPERDGRKGIKVKGNIHALYKVKLSNKAFKAFHLNLIGNSYDFTFSESLKTLKKKIFPENPDEYEYLPSEKILHKIDLDKLYIAENNEALVLSKINYDSIVVVK